jgi:hypothetical protein
MIIAALLLLGLFLVRPGASRLRWRISQSMSQQLGRRVEIGWVHLRFLPRPGFDLEDFVVRDDPAFGAEPILRSADVNASLRISALLRGRIEISTLSLNNASLNLTRDWRGKWNLNNLIERNASITTAPTSAPRRQARAEFPYIEASHARVNFKIGNEKIHFALNDAELALWQDSENAWGLRMKARPIRTDANLTDTGLLNVSGLWQRSAVLHDTPVQFAFEWKQAQAGQVSRLIFGNDRGWRGSVLLSGSLSGTPGALKVFVHTSVEDFGRFDAFSDSELRLAGQCSARYSSTGNDFSEINCAAPVGDGSLELTGNLSGPLSAPSYGLTLNANKVPAHSVISLLRRIKAKLPEDLAATGTLNGSLVGTRTDFSKPPELHGNGEIEGLTLRSGSFPALTFGAIPVALSVDPKSSDGRTTLQRARIDLAAFTLPMGRPSPVRARASVSLAGYEALLHGDAGIKRLLQTAQIMGVPSPAVSADGNSTVDLRIAGSWMATQQPIVTGTAQLRSVYAKVRGANGTLRVDSADLALGDQSVRVRNLTASATGSVWHGTLEIPRPCVAPDKCPFQFNLRTAEAKAAGMNEYLNPQAGDKPWYSFIPGKSSEKPYLMATTASGKLAIGNFILGKAVCTHFSSDVTLRSGKLTLTNVQGEVLRGDGTGAFEADFSSRPPAYRGSGKIDAVSLEELSSLTNGGWIEGIGSSRFQFKTTGYQLRELLSNADLNADFAVKDGVFPNVVGVGSAAALRARIFEGSLVLRDGNFSFDGAKLENDAGVYSISGTASMTGALDLKMLSESSAGYNLSGTIAKTRVSRILTSATQASLKP